MMHHGKRDNPGKLVGVCIKSCVSIHEIHTFADIYDIYYDL